jgi:hypothetical protein
VVRRGQVEAERDGRSPVGRSAASFPPSLGGSIFFPNMNKPHARTVQDNTTRGHMHIHVCVY